MTTNAAIKITSNNTPPHLALVPTPTGLKPSQRRQLANAPHGMRPAIEAAFDRMPAIRRIEAAGRLAIVVHAPTLATIVTLVTVLSVVDLVGVLGMVLRISGRTRVFAGENHVLDAALERVRRMNGSETPALVFSGASRECLTVRVPK